MPGERYAGGPPNPEALARPARGRGGARAGAGAKAGPKGAAKGRPKSRSSARSGTAAAGESDEQRYTRVAKRARPVEPAADA